MAAGSGDSHHATSEPTTDHVSPFNKAGWTRFIAFARVVLYFFAGQTVNTSWSGTGGLPESSLS